MTNILQIAIDTRIGILRLLGLGRGVAIAVECAAECCTILSDLEASEQLSDRQAPS